jgi:hypothetical protein
MPPGAVHPNTGQQFGRRNRGSRLSPEMTFLG